MGQQERWQERLQEYNFDIEHRPGHYHGNADALSRRPCGRSECCMPRRNILPARNRRVKRLAKIIAHARRQELIDDLWWLFTSEPQNSDTERRATWSDRMTKWPRAAPMYAVLPEENRLILSGWKEWPKAAPMYPAFSEESRLISSGGKEWPRAATIYPAFSEESRLILSGWKER